ncbi:hypothetical protein BZL30_5385 [Mycobacterium kansasii]|uniref:Uncharacterized protein n=1 Tax=Mycobacterium kansasii TaxID=1768 RepID=A0A1V3WBC3_MYCKA|nr:hypothetical protein BZL29_8330 [Mycobacterium kansasii]OOK71728.1 hypothetical protein BZL30_5385 [Mycobacterium kansasii]
MDLDGAHGRRPARGRLTEPAFAGVDAVGPAFASAHHLIAGIPGCPSRIGIRFCPNSVDTNYAAKAG